MQEICGRLNELKMLDYFNVIGGSAETFVGEAAAVPNMSFQLGLYTYLAASIRQVVDVPVITFGRIVDPIQADKILAAGDADLVIMNRALIADPHFPNKAQAGELDDIRQCMGYNEGCIDRIYTGRGVTCVQNPVIGREAAWSTLPVAAREERIVVVGGGPAGLEAARVSARQGHQVVLFEKSGELGGQTLIAKRAPGRQDFDGATRWSSRQCAKAESQYPSEPCAHDGRNSGTRSRSRLDRNRRNRSTASSSGGRIPPGRSAPGMCCWKIMHRSEKRCW